MEKNEGSATVSSSMTDFDGDGQPDTTDPDDDNDGMPDLYEQQYGLLAFLNDASLDKDGDGLTNLEELQIGTSPADPDSVLKATLSYTTGEPAAQLTWHGAAGRQYEVQTGDDIDQPFATLGTFQAAADGPIAVPVPPSTARRFFRIRTTTP
ncbi:MAG TPA: hypothetical protein P5555_09255 [Candidatus Paceibacterota bacterium]|nr:hypothetical protein [Verrucomicrobiota bacterium]HOX04177.1 hypothetical protein [Verrucomicrobiota bacterium]HRZ45362.1 hypothetical protein [Candidatus Paceibacterota bacterium]HRZ54008.1 hypothetical protein [Candidatus Paceibacterota bacterium]